MISFARGAPAPECLDAALLADCARSAIEGDPSVLAYGPGGGYGPLREWLGDRHGVEPGRVVVTNGGLQGFVFYAEELLETYPNSSYAVKARDVLAKLQAPVVEKPSIGTRVLNSLPRLRKPSADDMGEEDFDTSASARVNDDLPSVNNRTPGNGDPEMPWNTK